MNSTVMDVGSGDPHGYWPWLSSWFAARALIIYAILEHYPTFDHAAGGPRGTSPCVLGGAPTVCTSTRTIRCPPVCRKCINACTHPPVQPTIHPSIHPFPSIRPNIYLFRVASLRSCPPLPLLTHTHAFQGALFADFRVSAAHSGACAH